MTPEGIALRFRRAPWSRRIAAVLVDTALITAGSFALGVLAWLATGGSPESGWIGAATLLVSFLVRSFYFAWFETRWLGATPGKRYFGVRVIDRSGGPLTTEAVFVRNATREFEVFLPVLAVSSPDTFWPGAPTWAVLLALVWVVLLALLPLLNRSRLRIGDLVAGTVVVDYPRPQLGEDLASGVPGFLRFTDTQLDTYGAAELSVLERLLRERRADRQAALEAIAERVQRRIGWSGPSAPPEIFLRALYAALRARLERHALHPRAAMVGPADSSD